MGAEWGAIMNVNWGVDLRSLLYRADSGSASWFVGCYAYSPTLAGHCGLESGWVQEVGLVLTCEDS